MGDGFSFANATCFPVNYNKQKHKLINTYIYIHIPNMLGVLVHQQNMALDGCSPLVDGVAQGPAGVHGSSRVDVPTWT